MEEILKEWLTDPSTPLWIWPKLLLVIAGSIAVLGKSADWLVEEAVSLSEKSGIPKVIIGATIVSLGTTVPEAAVSVLAAWSGNPDLALGNAVGSIICDTGLILGLACLIAPLQLPPGVVNRQGWLQLGAGCLLVIMCLPWSDPGDAWSSGGVLTQWGGWVFLGLLVVYLVMSIRWARGTNPIHLEELESAKDEPILFSVVKLLVSIGLVILSSHLLIPAVEVAAEFLGIPKSIIAATLVAFGTSLPELVTAVTAARHGHGDLAVGNIVGADILNVLFVAGAAASVTPAGLQAEPHFFQLLFPIMLFVLVVFRIGIFTSQDTLKWGFGLVLLGCYLVFLYLNFSHLIRDPAHL